MNIKSYNASQPHINIAKIVTLSLIGGAGGVTIASDPFFAGRATIIISFILGAAITGFIEYKKEKKSNIPEQ